MKIYREVLVSERLPEKEGDYFVISDENIELQLFFKNNTWFDIERTFKCTGIESWLEPIEVEIDSQKILPLDERVPPSFDTTDLDRNDLLSILDQYHTALEAAELKNIQLQEENALLKEQNWVAGQIIEELNNKNRELQSIIDGKNDMINSLCS